MYKYPVPQLSNWLWRSCSSKQKLSPQIRSCMSESQWWSGAALDPIVLGLPFCNLWWEKKVTCLCRALFEVLNVSNLLLCGCIFIWLFVFHSLHVAWHGWPYEFNLRYLSSFRGDTEFKSVWFMLFARKKILFFTARTRN